MSYIDDYCERMGPGLWAEPFNAISNLAFLVAACAAALAWQRRTARDRASLALIVIVLAIGADSLLFHTFATRAAQLADVLPIALFIHLYFYLALRRYLRIGPWAAAAATGVFAISSVFLARLFEPVAGSSAGYLPALLALFGVAAAAWLRDREVAGSLALCGILFAVSIGMRMLDEPLCQSLPFGTHFAWHLLNAALLYVLTATMIGRPDVINRKSVNFPHM